MRRQIAERERAMAAAEAAPEMSGAAAAQLKAVLAGALLPGETVTAALRRLRPAPTRAAGRRGARPSTPSALPRLDSGLYITGCTLSIWVDAHARDEQLTSLLA